MNENDELEKENDDFESSQVTDGENFTADEKQDKKATNKTVPNNLTISECGEQPNDEQQHEDSYDFGFYEEFLKDFADEHGLTYTRNEENPDFEISLKADENTTHIQIDLGRNLTMTAKDNNNETVVPDQKMFNAIAELAHQQGNSITFGNIETPEYAARLYLACKTHQPPIEMIRAPEMNDEFLGKLDQETKKQIEMLVVAQQETENLQNQPADEITTANQEEDHVAEYDNNSNSVDNNATEHTEHNTTSTSTSESEGVQEEEVVEVDQSQEEDSSSSYSDEVPTESQEEQYDEEDNADSNSEVDQSQEEDSNSSYSDEVPTESQEALNSEEDNANSNSEVDQSQEEDSHSTNSFAAEIQERANVVRGKLNQDQNQEQDSLNKEQNNLNTKKAQAPTKKNILQYYQKNHVH